MNSWKGGEVQRERVRMRNKEKGGLQVQKTKMNNAQCCNYRTKA